MAIVTREVRDAPYWPFRILAVAERDGDRLNCPTLDFLRDQWHSNDLVRLTSILESTAKHGPPRSETKFKCVAGTSGLYEFKANQLRLFCFWGNGALIICTNGTVKKRDRTDSDVIEIALNWKRTYLAAKRTNSLRHETGH